MRIPYDKSGVLAREFIELGPEIEEAIRLTVVAGWRRALAFEDVNALAREIFITERLRDGMRSELKEARVGWGKSLIVLQGSESRSSSVVVEPDGRTDIPLLSIEIFVRVQEHDPHAIIECKRISGDDPSLCRGYVVEGIDRFTSSKYGENHAVGFMAGYIISGSPVESVLGINAYLTGQLRVPEHLSAADVRSNPESWVSRHPRRRRSDIIKLNHFFLGFAPPAGFRA